MKCPFDCSSVFYIFIETLASPYLVYAYSVWALETHETVAL